MLKGIAIFAAHLFLLQIVVTAQDRVTTEYGKTAELKGLSRIFVDTAGDTEERERIMDEFKKAKLDSITFTDSMDGAEIVLQFQGGTVAEQVGYVNNGVGHTGTNYRSAGKGIAFIPKPPNIMRVILSSESYKKWAWNAKPSAKFAKDFIKAYKEANQIN